jgi:hypothetical protein
MLGGESPYMTQVYHSSTPNTSSLMTSNTVNIDPLMIDNLAKDFNLEPMQRANLHAFVAVSN